MPTVQHQPAFIISLSYSITQGIANVQLFSTCSAKSKYGSSIRARSHRASTERLLSVDAQAKLQMACHAIFQRRRSAKKH